MQDEARTASAAKSHRRSQYCGRQKLFSLSKVNVSEPGLDGDLRIEDNTLSSECSSEISGQVSPRQVGVNLVLVDEQDVVKDKVDRHIELEMERVRQRHERFTILVPDEQTP